MSAFHKSLWPEIIRRYEAGDQIKLIAEDLGVDRKTVYNVARRARLPHRHSFDPARTERILASYRTGEPVMQIAAREGVHRSYVRDVARRAGLPPRSGWQRKYPIDEHAFDHPSGVGWWLIGLLAADGSIRGKGNLISLCQRASDADVLKAFLAYVGSPNRPLIELKLSPAAARRTWPRSPAFEARIHSRHICEVLARHGIVPRKTRSLRLSEEAARETAVWLGLLDGDGWVSPTGQRGRPRVDFYGTPALMRQCSDFWGARLDFQRAHKPAVVPHRGGLGHVALHGTNASRAAKILLASSPVSLRRKRRTLQAIAALGCDRGR